MRVSEILNEEQRLNELTRPNSMFAAGEILRKAGYKRLGEGEFAVIYGKPGKSHILKLFKATDEAYMEFINITLQHPDIHFPKFKGKLMKITDGYCAIQMEKLKRVTGFNASYVLATYITRMQQWQEFDIRPGPDMENLEKRQPGIMKTCQLIAQGISPNRAVDIHSENIMMRGNTLVITDPVAY